MKHIVRTSPHVPRRSVEAGVALFTCLMILLVLSLLGVTAMRMMAGQSQMAAGSLGAEISYSASASAINAVIRVGEGDFDTRMVLPRVGEDPRVICLDGSAGASQVVVDCSTAPAPGADARGVAQTRVTVIPMDPDDNTKSEERLKERVERLGSSINDIIKSEYFTFVAEGQVDALGISMTQVQEAYLPYLKSL